jgi:hypothetical protein
MFSIIPQLSRFSTVEVALLAGDLLTLFIAFIISYIAYQGYQRTTERAMLFVAAGFVLVFLLPGMLAVVVLIGSPSRTSVIAALAQVSELCGMMSILYGLWVPSR